MSSRNNISRTISLIGAFALLTLLPTARAACPGECLIYSNTALGDNALVFDTTGSHNTAIGADALPANTTGSSNTTGSNNLANGYEALYHNTTGTSNMATGYLALYANTTGFFKMANGSNAIQRAVTMWRRVSTLCVSIRPGASTRQWV